MSKETKYKVLNEASRVLKKNGVIDIWDIDVPTYNGDGKDFFVAQLKVECSGETISTGYGVLLKENDHTKTTIELMLEEIGLTKVKEEKVARRFRLKYIKSDNC